MEHHQTTLAAFAAQTQADDDALALVLTGSLARGTARPDSDVDVYLVVTEEAFEHARASDALSYVRGDVATYEGGYVDVKVASPSYLAAAAERADEPTRASLLGSRVVWSRLDGLEETLAAIQTLPDDEWVRRADSFVAQLRLYGGYFLPQGEQLADPYLLSWAAVHLVNAASRALLAHHRVLFAGPKYARSSVASLPERSATVLPLLDALLAAPSPRTGADVMTAVEAVVPTTLTPDNTLSRFVSDNELAWLWRTPTPEAL
jgi:predicted nucleotidyltransferase